MREMWSSQDWKEKLYAPFARTGWTPKSLPYQIEKDDFNAESFKKFNPTISKQHKIYALFQYLFITYIFLVFIQSGYLNYAELWVTISMVAFTMYCTSLWLDGKKGTRMEVFRLTLCIAIGLYAYLQMSLSTIAISLLVYSAINFLSLPLINKTT
jgi:hypothetical protein